MSDETITIKKENLWKYSTFVLGALVIVMALVIFTGDNSSVTGNVVANPQPSPSPNQQAPSPSAEQQRSPQVDVGVDDDAVLGDENAPVTIIEFSDYQCSFCMRFWSQTLPQIKSQYIESGKVKFSYRDLPLTSIHPFAQKAAESTECVREQGGDEAFWMMHDKIFENQAGLNDENLRIWAQERGYNIDTCLKSGKFRGEIQKDMQDAQRAGGRGTPYFIINGKTLSGACPFNAFQQAIDAELAGKEWYSPGSCQITVI
ncbi:MAG: DsbA family protein [Nanoarchaeota archaeon]|nr:DsbA family protein [Nanoarchaeota archaeon]MBU1051436.1 DsbA family protein [Nanoarchaeota archaeon]MBU1988643.1 DsbA family protein [Nanoarchaeota archaeon]